jgi:uncharacterized membrane protein
VSDLIAITFVGPEQAGKALRTLRQVERRGFMHVTDTAVIRKDADRPVHMKNELDPAVELGVSVVGTLGLLVAIALRVAGVTSRVAGGAWAGSQLHLGIDQEFLELLRNDLRPGTAALLVMVANMKPHAIPEIHEAMRPFHGAVYETTVSPHVQRMLCDVVEESRDPSTT